MAEQRWVHRHKPTGMFATKRTHGVYYDGTLQEAKVYRSRNGGAYLGRYSGNKAEDYEWVRVELTLVGEGGA